jgi:mono/diheme cytochrome c family protein
VFRGDCARCHVTPTVGKKGGELYTTACAICHEAPHRATMVPDLRAIKTPTGKEFWTQWISNGKPGSLMPAFASALGGPLNDEQIQSLAELLTQHFPSPAPSASTAGSGGAQAAAALN